MAQSVKQPTLDFGSGHDLTVHEFKPHIRLCADGMEPAWDSLSLSLSLSHPPFMISPLSKYINKLKGGKKKETGHRLAHVRTRGEDSHVQAKERGLGGDRPCPHLGLGLLSSRPVLCKSPRLWGFARAAEANTTIYSL